MHYGSAIFSPGILMPWTMALGAFFEACRTDRGAPVCHNSGAPHHRRKNQQITSTLLGNEKVQVHLPFEGGYGMEKAGFPSVLDRAWHLLDQAGYASPEKAAEAFSDLPQSRLHVDPVLPFEADRRLVPREMDDRETLRTALILGRCTGTLYDPFRPVIWTTNRLERWVRLYQHGSFYDDDE